MRIRRITLIQITSHNHYNHYHVCVCVGWGGGGVCVCEYDGIRNIKRSVHASLNNPTLSTVTPSCVTPCYSIEVPHEAINKD